MKLRLYRKAGTVYEDQKSEQDSEFYCLVDAVKYIMHLLEQILDHQSDERAANSAGYRIRASPWSQLEGYDFMDIATKSDVIRPVATTLQDDGLAWIELTRAIHAPVLFGKGFGELLQPVLEDGSRGYCMDCHWNISAPTQRDMLAVSMSEVERVVERRGAKSGIHWRLFDDFPLTVSPDLFTHSSKDSTRGCCQQPVQTICRCEGPDPLKGQDTSEQKASGFLPRLISKMSNRKNMAASSNQEVSIIPLDISAGGILLGMKRLQKPALGKAGTATQTIALREGHAGTQNATISDEGTSSPRFVVSATSSNQEVTQDADSRSQNTTESTAATELSNLASPAFPGHIESRALDESKAYDQVSTTKPGIAKASSISSKSDDYCRRRRAARRRASVEGNKLILK